MRDELLELLDRYKYSLEELHSQVYGYGEGEAEYANGQETVLERIIRDLETALKEDKSPVDAPVVKCRKCNTTLVWDTYYGKYYCACCDKYYREEETKGQINGELERVEEDLRLANLQIQSLKSMVNAEGWPAGKLVIAKLRMKKIPDTCAKCSMSEVHYVGMGWMDSERRCRVTGKLCPMRRSSKNGCMEYIKPDNCPLVLING